ncbi:MAG TPA: ATP-binding protein [Planctomycetota bacterium]|nr:ATP-binding protein [Planctomycetota bacterium]
MPWLSIGVFAVVLAATLGAFFIARDLKAQSQREALLRRAENTADALEARAVSASGILEVASAVAEASDGDAARFERLVGTRVSERVVGNFSLVRLADGTATPVASVGPEEPVLLSRLTPAEVQDLRDVARRGTVSAVSLGSVDGHVTTLLGAPGTPDGRFVVTAEVSVSDLVGSIPAVAGEGVDWALYAATPLGRVALASDTNDLPLRAPSVTREIQALGGTATLVVAAQGSLVSGVRGYLQWLVLVFGVMLAVIAVLLIEASRRRAAASERHRLLVEQNERLRQLDQQKDEFISLVSHDLRTPLTSIIGYTELLLEQDAGGSPENRHFLEVIERNGRRLLGMVEDLLFMARLQAGRLQLDRSLVDLGEIAGQCVEALQPKAAEAGVRLSVEADAVEVYGDERRLGQLVDNLVSNALKFSLEGGHVAVRVRRAPGTALLEVEDTGIGIPSDEVGRLFDRFYRASSATEREMPGTGLGLTIAKAIVDSHNGTIQVRSSEGVGTAFRIEIPTGIPEQPPEREDAEHAVETGRARRSP